MKTKAFLILVTLGLFLAGCASTQQAAQQAGGNAPASTTSLVRALGSNAKANGATVTLTGEASVAKALVVPEGITLDLTADRARLFLRDGATLTVNGTVNARGSGDWGKGWVNGGLAIEDGATVINGSGTINLKGKGDLIHINGRNGRKLTLDGVTLVGVADNDRSLVGVSEGGEFVLKSGAITGNTVIGDDWAGGGGVHVYKATFTMEGGEISGNTAQGGRDAGGGGVNINEESVFTMKSGAITGNTAIGGNDWAGGGGLSMYKATFTMEGGEISGNTAKGGRGAGGGGVHISEESVFTMTGGEISGNTAQGGEGSEGAGVSVHKATFTMEGGEISGNTAQGGEGSNGGGVDIGEGSVFTMSGGEISANTAASISGSCGGGGVAVDKATFTMSGGTISGNSLSSKERFAWGGGVSVWESIFTMSGGTISNNSAVGRDAGGGGGGVSIIENASVFTMKGGVISGNTAVNGQGGFAGGVWARGGAFIIEGGRIYGNVNSLPAGTDASLANNAVRGASIQVYVGTAKWGTGGTYTRGGVSQTGGSTIITAENSDDTLIAVPAR